MNEPVTIAARILVVDDNLELQRMLSRVLCGAGYEVTTAGTVATAATEITDGEPFDAAVLDIDLPDGKGFDIVAILRDVQPGCGVMMISGDMDDSKVDCAQALGVTELLQKPFDPPAMLSSVRTVLA